MTVCCSDLLSLWLLYVYWDTASMHDFHALSCIPFVSEAQPDHRSYIYGANTEHRMVTEALLSPEIPCKLTVGDPLPLSETDSQQECSNQWHI